MGRLGTLALVSLGVALVLAEGGVRAFGLVPEVRLIDTSSDEGVYQHSDNPLLGFELKPNYRNESADFSGSYERTNAHGQRDLERDLAKPPGVKRVILLGDSIVEGSGIRDLDDTISRQMERREAGGGLEVLNFGVSGYSTRAEVELLETKGLAFAPDAVVLLFTENDFTNLNRDMFRWRGREARPAWLRWLFPRSALFRLVTLRLDLWGLRRELHPFRADLEPNEENLVVEGIARFAALADREGFQPLVAIWPHFTDERISEAFALSEKIGGRHDLVIDRLARMHGLHTTRLKTAFRQHRRELPNWVNPRSHYTQDDGMHPTPEGAAVAADALREALAAIEERPRPEPERRPDDDAFVAMVRTLGHAEPNVAAYHNQRGLNLEAAGKLEDAEAHYRRALAQQPDLADARRNLGMLLLRRGEVDAALVHLRLAIEADGEHAMAYYGLGLALQANGDLPAARDAFRRALELQPKLEPAREALAAAGG